MKSKFLIGFLAVLMIAGVGTLISLLNQSIDESSIKDVSVDATTSPSTTTRSAESSGPAVQPRRKEVGAETTWILRGYGTIGGRVVEFGTEKPVGDHPFRLVAVGGPDRTIEGKTSADGTFALKNVPNYDQWTLQIEARPPFKSSEVGAIVVTANRATDLGTIYLSPNFVVRGSIVNDVGSGIGGVRVMAQRLSGGESSMDMMKLVREIADEIKCVAEAVTAEDGSFVFANLAPGNYDFLLSSDHYAVQSEKGWAITPDIEKHPLRFTMSRGFSIDGRVVRKDGGSPVGVRVVAVVNLDDEDSLTHPTKVMTLADDQGTFRLSGLPAGGAVIAAAFPDRPTVIAEDVRVPGKSFVEIVVDGQAILVGRIFDEESRPIAGADITALLAGQSGSVATARSDAEGFYRVAGLPTAPMPMVFISAEGFAPYPEDLMSMARRPAASAGAPLRAGKNERDFTLKRGSIVRGVVRQKMNGRPIEGALVVLSSGTSTFTGNPSTSTDADGKFEIRGLGIGPALLSVKKDGYCARNPSDEMMMAMTLGGAPTGKSGDEMPGVVHVKKLGETIDVTLEIEPAPIFFGRVTDADGRAVPGARVDARVKIEDEDGEAPAQMSRALGSSARFCDADGRFSISAPLSEDGKIVLVAEAPGFASGQSEPRELGAGEVAADINIVLRRGGTIDGRVIDESGRPIAGASVRRIVDGEVLRESDWDRAGRGASVTDDDGRFRMTTVEPGNWAIRAVAFGRKPSVERAISVTENASVAVTLRLERGLSIEGIVVDDSGRPIAGADVSAVIEHDDDPSAPDGAPSPSRPEDVRTKADGTFGFFGLSPMKVSLVARADGHAASTRVRAAAGDQSVRLVLRRPQTISGKVVAGGLPVVGIAVTVDGEEFEIGRREKTVITDESGAFLFSGLTPGNYMIWAKTEGWRNGDDDLNVVPGFLKNVPAGSENVILNLELGAIVSGTVRRSDGGVTDGAEVEVYFVGGEDGTGETRSEPAFPLHRSALVKGGRFSVRGLSPGKYRVVVELDDGTRKQVTVTAPAADVAIVLGGGCKIQGRVVDAGGQGCAGAFVYFKSGETTASRQCDERGIFSIDGLEPGRYTVGAWQGARTGKLDREIEIAASGSLDLGSIVVREE